MNSNRLNCSKLNLVRDLLKNPEVLVEKFFLNDEGSPLKLTSYQIEFLKDVLNREYSKMVFCAATRSGKSRIIAVAMTLFAILNPREEIVIISYTWEQSKIIFNYIKSHITEHPELLNKIDKSNEFSNQQINLINGTKIVCRSAGGSSKGESLLGFGASVLVIDESGSIEDSIYYQKIMRMIASGRRERFVIESGTPHRKGHFFETFNNPNYKNYRVSWEDAVKAGQMNEEEVLQMKERLSDIEFKMWYEALFPDEAEDSLFKYQDVLNAVDKEILGDGEKVLGVDVARFGVDLSVFLSGTWLKEMFRADSIDSLKKADLMKVTGKIVALDNENKYNRINIDVIGMGGGVVDRLKEIKTTNGKIIAPHFGESPNSEEDKKKFANKKAEYYFKLARLFEQGLISIPKHKVLIDELLSMSYSFTSNGKLRIEDPTKSPDYADALVFAIWKDEGGFVLDW